MACLGNHTHLPSLSQSYTSTLIVLEKTKIKHTVHAIKLAIRLDFKHSRQTILPQGLLSSSFWCFQSYHMIFLRRWNYKCAQLSSQLGREVPKKCSAKWKYEHQQSKDWKLQKNYRLIVSWDWFSCYSFQDQEWTSNLCMPIVCTIAMIPCDKCIMPSRIQCEE